MKHKSSKPSENMNKEQLQMLFAESTVSPELRYTYGRKNTQGWNQAS